MLSPNSSSRVCRMNAQLRPILDLLREVENINLSSEILEPELHSIQQVILDTTDLMICVQSMDT